MARDIKGLRGVVPPVVTPLQGDFTVDYPSFTRVIEHLIAGGVHGLFFLGSTSEVVFHDEATRDRILAHAVGVVAGRLPVLAGVVDPATDRVIGHARRAASLGVDGVVVTAPFYTRTSAAETVEHFRCVAAGSPVPVVAYDLPVSVHSKLARETVVGLAREGAIVGLKDSSGDGGGLRYVIADMADRPDFFCMTGGELDVDGALLMGAHGVVPGLGNVDPGGYVRLYEAAMQGNWAVAKAEQARLCRLFEIVWCGVPRTSAGASGVGGFKTAMRAMGIVATNTMARPQRSLNAEESARVEAIMRGAGLL
ncbi:MAG: dihydrodipicolinate synthase family protein [Acetobacteraceae bacterium]|nr:dihydrodipicolinate synthase family protein [Acetobacteraceae bacterium]